MFKKIILLVLCLVSIYSCKMNESVNEEKLQKLKQIYTIIGNEFDNKATEYEWGPSEDTNSLKYQKFKEDILKKPSKTTYGESGGYICEDVTFEFFKVKTCDIIINFIEKTIIVDESDGTKWPLGTSYNSLSVENFNSLELSDDQSIVGKWTPYNVEKTGTFKFNIDQSKPNTIFFEVTNGDDQKFNATVELSNDKFIKVKEILNDF